MRVHWSPIQSSRWWIEPFPCVWAQWTLLTHCGTCTEGQERKPRKMKKPEEADYVQKKWSAEKVCLDLQEGERMEVGPLNCVLWPLSKVKKLLVSRIRTSFWGKAHRMFTNMKVNCEARKCHHEAAAFLLLLFVSVSRNQQTQKRSFDSHVGSPRRSLRSGRLL